jgi:eukaryotic-like serine/threonine-protein kinase
VAILNTVAQFGRYILRTRLAAAGACEVWLAEIDGTEHGTAPVVFKKLRTELAQSAAVLESFTQRARRAMHLDHDCIGRVLDVVVDRSACGYAAEFIDGITLRQLVSAVGSAGNALPVWFAIHVTRRICQALEHAHEGVGDQGQPHRILHEHLCPENVFLTFAGQVKVTDFGLSQKSLLPGGSSVPQDTMRTPASSDWEEPQTETLVSFRQDLDGIGRVLYELLTGIAPTPSEPPVNVFLPPSHHAPWVKVEVDQLLSRMLVPTDPKRFQTAGEIRHALDEYLSSRRHEVTATHVAGLVSVLFSPECHESGPPTMRLQEAAAELAKRRSRRTTPPDFTSDDFASGEIPTYNPIAQPSIPASAIGHASRPTVPAPLTPTPARDEPLMEPAPQTTATRQPEQRAENTSARAWDNAGSSELSHGQNSGNLGADTSSADSLGADNRNGPFHHDWDLALKRAREESQSAQRISGSAAAVPPAARPAPPIDPLEQAIVEFERGLEHMRHGEFDRALTAWEQALELDPQHRVCRANLSLLKKKLGSQT